jgi:Zn-finger nucleic acid-binding protein
MNCPRCPNGVKLVSTQYEGFHVYLCPSCHGFLLTPNNLRGIERKQEIGQSTLESESAVIKDSPHKVACPKCHVQMRRSLAPHGLDFAIDVCKPCKLIWLDGGELEAIQLAYERSPAGRDALQRQQEMLNMSEERQAELEANIAKAPDSKELQETVHEIFGRRHGPEGLVGDILSIFLNF